MMPGGSGRLRAPGAGRHWIASGPVGAAPGVVPGFWDVIAPALRTCEMAPGMVHVPCEVSRDAMRKAHGLLWMTAKSFTLC